MQLDAALESLINHFDNLTFPINVIYHWSNMHETSYQKLKNKWEPKGVVFYQRGDLVPKSKIAKLLFRPLNLYWYLKWPWIRSAFDDFKYLVEDLIEKSSTDFISFSTDDQIMFDRTLIPESAFELMRRYPKLYSYRFNTSIGFDGEYAIPLDLKVKMHYENSNPIFFEWDNQNNCKSVLWNYRFHVDGTVYKKRAILSLLKPILYHMPTTLEGAGLWESRFRNYFRFGLSSVKRTSVGIQANNIQTASDTPCAFFEPEMLRQAYEDGYRLLFDKVMVNEKEYIYIPNELTLQNELTDEIITYTDFVFREKSATLDQSR